MDIKTIAKDWKSFGLTSDLQTNNNKLVELQNVKINKREQLSSKTFGQIVKHLEENVNKKSDKTVIHQMLLALISTHVINGEMSMPTLRATQFGIDSKTNEKVVCLMEIKKISKPVFLFWEEILEFQMVYYEIYQINK